MNKIESLAQDVAGVREIQERKREAMKHCHQWRISITANGQLLNVQPTTGDFAAINERKLMRELNYQITKK